MSDSSSAMEDATDSFDTEKSKQLEFPQVKPVESSRVSIQLSFSKAREYLDPKDAEDTHTTPVIAQTYKVSNGLFTSLPSQVERVHRNKVVNFNFIVAGRSGLGKSTFTKMLFPQTTPLRPVIAVETKYPVKSTQLDLERYFVQEKGVKADVSIIDTPGFGEYIDNRNCWVPICNYIDKQHMVYMYQEEQPKRARLVDTRVNACVYFIEHTGRMLSEMDLTSMREISLRANLIPVIAKADCITPHEMKWFKELIKKQLESNNIKVYRNMDPLGVACSDVQANIGGSLKFARVYSYGSMSCEDPRFSDFLKLRDLLLSENTLDLIDATHSVYYRYHRVVLMHYRYRKAIESPEDDNMALKPPMELLQAIGTIKMSTLIKEHLEKDPLFLQQVAKVRARYNQVGNDQTKQFSEYQMGLHAKQLDYEKELKQIRYDINDLKEHIRTAKLRLR